MLVKFDNKGEPFIGIDSLRLVPEINDLLKRNLVNQKALLLYICCMVDYESPFLVKFPEIESRKEAVLKAYSGRIIGGGKIKREDTEKPMVLAAMQAYHAYQKDNVWDFYFALEKKIAECDSELNTIKVDLTNVDEQKKLLQLRKEAYLTFEDVRKQILTKVSTSTTSTGKAKAHQLKDIQFVK